MVAIWICLVCRVQMKNGHFGTVRCESGPYPISTPTTPKTRPLIAFLHLRWSQLAESPSRKEWLEHIDTKDTANDVIIAARAAASEVK